MIEYHVTSQRHVDRNFMQSDHEISFVLFI